MKKLKPAAVSALLTALVFAVCLAVPALMLRSRTAPAEEESPATREPKLRAPSR